MNLTNMIYSLSHILILFFIHVYIFRTMIFFFQIFVYPFIAIHLDLFSAFSHQILLASFGDCFSYR
ncbi:uncharacterized protein DS421_8g245570 [Arachis hypogaea]|nr:uncharacterized protein DS421_8g245570 [Arachis hypogaea]